MLLALDPLAADERRSADVFHRAALPADVPDQGVEVGAENGVTNGFLLRNVLGPLEHVRRDLEERVCVAERLVPLLAAGRFVGIGKLLCALSRQGRLERATRRPPCLLCQAFACLAQGFDSGRKGQRLADGHDFRLESLLARLSPEVLEVRRRGHAADDLDVRLLEGRDLRTEVRLERLISPRVDNGVALFLERRGQTQLAVAPGVAVTVVGEQEAHNLVGRDVLPDVGEHRDDVFQAPEEVVRPFEALLRIAAAAEEPRLPGTRGRDAGHPV